MHMMSRQVGCSRQDGPARESERDKGQEPMTSSDVVGWFAQRRTRLLAMASTTTVTAADVAEEIIALLHSTAEMSYIGERVSQLEHALQAAHAAADRGDTEARRGVACRAERGLTMLRCWSS